MFSKHALFWQISQLKTGSLHQKNSKLKLKFFDRQVSQPYWLFWAALNQGAVTVMHWGLTVNLFKITLRNLVITEQRKQRNTYLSQRIYISRLYPFNKLHRFSLIKIFYNFKNLSFIFIFYFLKRPYIILTFLLFLT